MEWGISFFSYLVYFESCFVIYTVHLYLWKDLRATFLRTVQYRCFLGRNGKHLSTPGMLPSWGFISTKMNWKNHEFDLPKLVHYAKHFSTQTVLLVKKLISLLWFIIFSDLDRTINPFAFRPPSKITWHCAHMRIVSHTFHFAWILICPNINYPVVLNKPNWRMYCLATFLVGFKINVLLIQKLR